MGESVKLMTSFYVLSLKCNVLCILGQYSSTINVELVFKTGLLLIHANDKLTTYHEIDKSVNLVLAAKHTGI
jgi:hypothetical protein